LKVLEERSFSEWELEEGSLERRIDERWYPMQWMMEERPIFSSERELERELRAGSFLGKRIDERCPMQRAVRERPCVERELEAGSF
jgi:hypothetical protein